MEKTTPQPEDARTPRALLVGDLPHKNINLECIYGDQSRSVNGRPLKEAIQTGTEDAVTHSQP